MKSPFIFSELQSKPKIYNLEEITVMKRTQVVPITRLFLCSGYSSLISAKIFWTFIYNAN